MTISEGQTDVGGGGSSQESLPGSSGLYAEIFHDDEPVAVPETEPVTEASDDGTKKAAEVTKEASVEADIQQAEVKEVKKTEPETKADATTKTDAEDKTEVDTKVEAKADEPEFTDEQYAEGYKKFKENEARAAELDKMATDLEAQKAGVDKDFNEQALKFKALREELGISKDTIKDDKRISKDMDKVGDTAPVDYVSIDYFNPEFLAKCVETRVITAKQAQRFTEDKMFLNVIFNGIASRSHDTAKRMHGDLDGKIAPMVQQRDEKAVNEQRAPKWLNHFEAFFKKHGNLTKEQVMVFQKEFEADPSLQAMVDVEGNEARIETRIRQIINDPGAKVDSGFGVVPLPREVKEKVKVVEVDTGTKPEPKKKKSVVETITALFD